MTWLCSADSHFDEPSDLWIKRLPSSLQGRAPHLEWTDAGRETWVEGQLDSVLARGVFADEPRHIPDRIDLMEQQGIWSEVLIGNVGAGTVLGMRDAELATNCARAYNDYLAEVYGPYGDRQIAVGLVPILDLSFALKEIERVASLGLHGVTMPIMTAEHAPYFHEVYEELWAAAAAQHLPILFHINTGGRGGPENAIAAAAVSQDQRTQAAMRSIGVMTGANQAFNVLASLVGSGVLERYPELHIVFVECEAAWLASAIEALDYGWGVQEIKRPGLERFGDDVMTVLMDGETGEEVRLSTMQRMGGGWPYSLRPSDYVRRQVHATFIDEPAAVKFREFIGTQQLMWGSDFPHGEGTFPDTKEILDQLFDGVSVSDRDAMTSGAAAQLYGIKLPVGSATD